MNALNIETEDDVRSALSGHSDFEIEVCVAVFKIPEGMVSTYSRIAKKVGRPNAYRAVANVMGKCPLYPLIPCHRVVTTDGRFTGSIKGGVDRMKRLTEEGIPIEGGRVRMSKEIIY